MGGFTTDSSELNKPAVRFQPSLTEVEKVITHAASHTLGLDFLLNGSLDAVAATFEVHAFTVDAARDSLRCGTHNGMANVSTESRTTSVII